MGKDESTYVFSNRYRRAGPNLMSYRRTQEVVEQLFQTVFLHFGKPFGSQPWERGSEALPLP